jgi:hypothetical protein
MALNRLFPIVVVLALLGQGCSKIKRPRVDDPRPSPPVAPVAGASESLTDECPDVGAPEALIAQYRPLRELVNEMAEGTPERRQLDAHGAALRRAIQFVRGFLQSRRDADSRRKLRDFNRFVQRQIRPAMPRGTWEEAENDLVAMFRALHMREGSTCGNTFLASFYATYVGALDPFGRLEPVSEIDAGGPGGEDPLLLPEGEWAQPRLELREDREGLAVLTIRRWENSDGLRDAVWNLNERARNGAIRGILLDLRAAAGTDRAALGEARNVFAGWVAELPMVIWIDALTRGTPEIFVNELRSRERVLVAGEASFGREREICSRERVLAPGTPSMRLTMGCARVSSADGIPAAVRVAPGDEQLAERARLAGAGVRTPSRPAAVAGEPAPLSPGQPDERDDHIGRIRALIPGDRPGSLEDMVGAAALWAE